MQRTGSLLCLGLDPELPAGADASGLVEANVRLIEATAGLVCAYKPNLGFYLAYGAAGVAALEETLRRLPPDIPTILDAKWGDLGNSSAAYARAAFERWGVDAVTANPYQGRDALAPYLADPRRGAFILSRTSNPSAVEFQSLDVGGEALYLRVARQVQSWGMGGNVGLVVGATAPDELRAVRQAVPDALILAPGLGAQGGDLAAAVVAGVDRRGLGLLLPVSRGIARAADPRAEAQALVNAINDARSKTLTPTLSQREREGKTQALATALFDAGCVRFGQFTLASGRTSPFYFDLRLLVSEPALLKQVAAAYGELLRGLAFDRLAAIPYAALPIGTAVALHLERPLVYPRKEVKAYGTGKPVEGRFKAGETAVVVDDVITSGGSKLEAIATLEAAGLKVRDIVVLIDREEGGREPLEAKGYRVHAVLRLTEMVDALAAAGRLTDEAQRAIRERG
ncbi:MAG: orotidine-5'-phosphate decarboxylase [Anaerolineae bacterium]|nr:orotidine-5'-phosphate decarboxylase [Anaerolineae bacterium]